MNCAWRLILFAAGGIGLALFYGLACSRLPGPGELRDRYLREINFRTKWEQQITDAVTAVNFDYRGFDTLGEEFILFVSVMGTLVLLREAEEKHEQEEPDALTKGRDVSPGDALRVWTMGMTGPTVLFGLYIVVHGQLTPGGGFQGGVILATAPLLIYLTDDFKTFKRVASHRLVEIAEACGAGAYAVIGLIALFYGKEFLANVFPLGQAGNLFSGGTVWAISFVVGLEVAAGFTLLLYAFLQDTLSGSET